MVPSLYNLMMVVVAGIFFLRLWQTPPKGHFQAGDSIVLFYISSGALALALLLPGDAFGKMCYISWFLFFHLPILLVFFAWRLQSHYRFLRVLLVLLALPIVAVGIDAFLVEPQALEVSFRQFVSPKVDRPIRIIVLADIQTDAPGDYERRVLAQAKEQKPDLILFAGDYLQVEYQRDYLEAAHKLNAILKQADLSPSLGTIAVRGNIDYTEPWQTVFDDTETIVIEETRTVDLGPVVVTGLSMTESYNTDTTVVAQDKYHIVLGHVPNFAQGDIQADLLCAGHIHGGQVRLPWIGPLLTFCDLPRAWAVGQTEIRPGTTLIVSRGIGLERGQAPRLRFLCRPELVVVDILPAEGQ